MIDSHAHLGFDELADDVDGYVARARGQGVSAIMAIACHPNQYTGLVELIEKYQTVYGCYGLHPQEIDLTVSADDLFAAVQHPKIVAIGETGVDLYYHPDKWTHQKKNFETHIEVAHRTKLPLVIHTRDAETQTVDMLRAHRDDLPATGVLHCFTGSADLSKKALDLGYYISASGIITFKKSQDLRDTFALVPLDRLLIETDAPYLAPEPFRGKQNESAYVPYTLQKLAEIKGISVSEMDEITTDNFYRLFKKAKNK